MQHEEDGATAASGETLDVSGETHPRTPHFVAALALRAPPRPHGTTSGEGRLVALPCVLEVGAIDDPATTSRRRAAPRWRPSSDGALSPLGS
jgi:hypothetical protein